MAMSELEIAGRLLTACLLGGLIGAERDVTGHEAGLRTNILVCLGAALFMVMAELLTTRYLGLSPAPDPSRIASTVITGIGFLGAGVIFQSQQRVRNLTTAATIWVVAAVGMLAGGGFLFTAATGTAITLTVLLLLPRVEGWLERRSRAARREAAGPPSPD
jgi:putative Mg2+ transporter-C (MgtC) family protein